MSRALALALVVLLGGCGGNNDDLPGHNATTQPVQCTPTAPECTK